MGIGSVLSFNAWSQWHPLGVVHRFESMTVFDVLDFVASNLMLPVGALLTCTLIGWRLPSSLIGLELPEEGARVRACILFMLRYLCPLGIIAVLVAALA